MQRTLDVTTLPWSQCTTALRRGHPEQFNSPLSDSYSPFHSSLSESQYCAYYSDADRGVCNEHSGAAIQLLSNEMKVSKIIGIASLRVECGSNRPDLYTRVASYVDWIESIVWKDGFVMNVLS